VVCAIDGGADRKRHARITTTRRSSSLDITLSPHQASQRGGTRLTM
jgi:hypothetical protein